MKLHLFLFSVFFLLLFKIAPAQISGCTDPLASNFNPSATQNDGSCTYNEASVAPTTSFNLSEDVKETSGLILWNNSLWTINDSHDIKLYAVDTLNGNTIQSYTVNGVINSDWEEISQDANYVYIGDFGNNETGNRKDLRILRVEKNSLLANAPQIETINFAYEDQTDFTNVGSNNTDFDSEAFVVTDDSIFIFTKQWISQKTSVYSFPKAPGTYSAKLRSTYNVAGLITGATLLPSDNLIALSGYSASLQPFIFLLYDYKNTDYFGGNKRKISVSLPFHQVGGITTSDGLKYFISNEYFSQPPLLTTSQKLHTLDLSDFLSGYLNTLINLQQSHLAGNELLYPNPASDFIHLKMDKQYNILDYEITNLSGQIVLKGQLTNENPRINITTLPAGIYFLSCGDKNKKIFKVIKNR